MHFLRRNRKIITLILAAVMCVAFTSCQDSAKSDKTYELSLAHFFPGTHPAETVFIQGWIKAIDEATDGQVKITSYPGGTLLAAPDVYNGVVDGVADIGMSCFAYTRGRFPVLEAFELPGVTYNNSKVASKVAWEGIKELDPEEVQDTELMMVIATGPGNLFTKEPVRNLDDLQGMEIRATGISANTIELLGGIPVGMAQSETYESLQKGIVKGNLAPNETLKGWNNAEVTKYVTITPFLYNTLFFVTFNSESWSAIPEDLQEKILDVTNTYQEEVGIGLWDMQNEEAVTWATQEQGVEFIELADDDKAVWVEKVLPVQETYKASLKEMGITEDVMALVNELAEKYNGEYK